MKAISLWQPWASAMALGHKKIGTRGWPTNYRGPLLIHAAKRWRSNERDFALVMADIEEDRRFAGQLPFGAIVAIGNLKSVICTEALATSCGLSIQEERWGDYGPNRSAWVFDQIRPLPEPVPFRGS